MPANNTYSKNKMRRWLIIGIGLIVIILIGIFVWWWLQQRELAPVVLQPQVITADGQDNTNTTPIDTIVAPVGAELSVIARNFVERYGSFSNQSNKQNMRDIWSLITPAFQNRLDLSPSQTTDQTYSGIETRVISMKVISESPSVAELQVKVQRSERNAELQQKNYYQDSLISLIKSGDQWLVDSIEWK